MTKCCVRFFKDLCNSEGHPFNVLQRSVIVKEAGSRETTLALAQKRFAELEGVPDWRLHADRAEIMPVLRVKRRPS